MEGLVNSHWYFEENNLLDGEPVKFSQDGGDLSMLGTFLSDSRS